jgi:hypothetical protein
MSGDVPPLPQTLSCAQEQRCLYIYRSVINISGLFRISELLFVEVVKIMHRPRTCRFLPQKFVPETPVQSVPLWDTADCAGGTRWVVCVFVQWTCCASGCSMYADRCCMCVWFATIWRFVACCSDTVKYRHWKHRSSCYGIKCRGELF